MLKRFSRWSIQLLLIALVSFLTYVTVPVPTAQAQACYRLNTWCSYRVTTWTCFRNSCSNSGCVGYYRCCYYEEGQCISYPTESGFSQICGGLCGEQYGP